MKSHLGTKGLAEAAGILGLGGTALEGLLSSKVEAAVHDLRRSAPATSSAAHGGVAPPLAPAPAV